MRICVFTVRLCLVVASALFLLLCSTTSCLGSQYQFCHHFYPFQCGAFSFIYPFGQNGSGCGDPAFQLDCDDHSVHPLLDISGEKYRILSRPRWDIHSMTIVNDNLFGDKCNLSGNYSQFWWPGYSHFQIAYGYSNITLWKHCDQIPENVHGNLSLCGDDWYYSLTPRLNPGRRPFCNAYQLPIQNNPTQSKDYQSLLQQGFNVTWSVDWDRFQSCSESWGICGHNMSEPFLCYCPNGSTYQDRCPSPNDHDESPNDGGTGYPKFPPIHGGTGRKIYKSAIVIGCSCGGVALIATAILFLTFYRKRRQQPPPRSCISKVETFLREYAYEMPTRYSQSQLKKMTNNFAEKLGEGGYGVVYKGKLPNGTLVAAKLLDRHRHSESTQFVNEVATIGRVHHVNLVRLLGYCFESSTSAVVYEYMVNGSLEKFIFAEKEKERILRWEQLYSIALGTARGIAYLHQDCEKRIIHFDIKPHNILLDAEFTPKVSDFGLAKLCGKEDDHISVTAVRGTPGYVAPEMCDRQMGPVTDKSDVYSFGMLLLEIVGGRKNIDVHVSRSSRLYFPEWAFKMLESEELGMRLGGGREGEIHGEDEEKARRLTKVGLWCIQYNSRDRPCMSRVVQMLEGNGEDVSNPPSPFNSSDAPQNPPPSSTERSGSM